MESVYTASYSVLLTRKPRGFINPCHGIKQDNPLLLYLFLVCAEGLSFLLRKAAENQQIHGVLSCKYGVHITHLLFAN